MEVDVKILAIAGSSRAASSNAALLRAAAKTAPDGLEVEIYNELGKLPIFNPDLTERLPSAAETLREHVLAADGLLIASPEYAHGVPGGMKNALDWMVGWGEVAGLPVALFHTLHYGGQYARANLIEILTTMSLRIVPEASLTVRMRGKTPAEMNAILSTPKVAAELRRALTTFACTIRARASR